MDDHSTEGCTKRSDSQRSPRQDLRRPNVKITDLTITLHRWEVPPTTYTDRAGGTKQVGVVTIQTDEGVEGHSFLGSAFQGADEFAGPLLERLKPVVMGRNPLD